MSNDFDLLAGPLVDVPDDIKEYYVSQEERDSAAAHAEKAGCTIIRGSGNELLLDFDEPYVGGKKYGNPDVWKIIADYFGPITKEYWRSRGGNTHCRVKLAKVIEPGERVALEAALGSDPKRAALTVARLDRGVVGEAMLFRPVEKFLADGP